MLAFTPTLTPIPTKTPVPKKCLKISGKSSGAHLPMVTTIPNPAWGKKITFRIMSDGFVRARIKIYNRDFDPIDELSQEGVRYFDILWNLTTVSEGLYYYQTQIEDKDTGKITSLPMQKFVVLKETDEKEKPKKVEGQPKPDN